MLEGSSGYAHGGRPPRPAVSTSLPLPLPPTLPFSLSVDEYSKRQHSDKTIHSILHEAMMPCSSGLGSSEPLASGHHSHSHCHSRQEQPHLQDSNVCSSTLQGSLHNLDEVVAGNSSGARRSHSEGSICPPAAATLRGRPSRSSHDGQLKCQFCPKKWSDQNALQQHMQDCRVARAHECQHCGRRFKARGGLQQHMRIHNNERPYQCHFCPKRFTQKSHLDQHERIHTGSKPFACQFCGRAFRQRSQQLGHESTHATHSLRQRSKDDSQATPPLTELSFQQQIIHSPSDNHTSSSMADHQSRLPRHLDLLALNTTCASTVSSLLALVDMPAQNTVDMPQPSSSQHFTLSGINPNQ